jgi:hypothetical protein
MVHLEFTILVKIDAASHRLLTDLMQFYTLYVYCPYLVKFGVRHFNIMPFRMFEFRENWRREDLTFVFGVHGITFMRV